MDEDLLIPPMENLLLKSEDNSADSMDDDGLSSTDSDEEIPVLAATEVELVHGVAGRSYLLAKKGWSLKLAVSFDTLAEISDECEQLIAAKCISHMKAMILEVISDAPYKLVVYAKSLKMQDSYPLKEYSCDELAYLDKTGKLELHLMAKEKNWCLISVDGFDNLFGTIF